VALGHQGGAAASSVARAVAGGEGGRWRGRRGQCRSKTVTVEKKWGKEGKEKGSTVSKSPYAHRWPHH
jgi:hypothetical protein